MLYTTLNKIRACRPCQDGWGRLLRHLGKTQADDEPLSYAVILESNGVGDSLWAMRSTPEHAHHWRRLAAEFAQRVAHLNSVSGVQAAVDAGTVGATEAAEAAWAARASAWAAEATAWAAEATAWGAGAAPWAAERAAQAALFLKMVTEAE